MTNDLKLEERGSDMALSRFRERVAAFIALLVIVSALAMIGFAFHYIDDNDKFARAKDLLLIINPVLGVVIGYYFNKVSTEARAENAENTARTATADARQAAESRNQAEGVADAAKADAEETRQHLNDVSQAAEKMLAQAPSRGPATLGVSEAGKPAEDPRWDLEAALSRAKRSRRA